MNPITIAAAWDRGASLPRAERWRRALMRRLAWLTGLALVAGTLPAWQDRVPGETLRWMADLAVHWQWLYAAAGAAAGLVWLLLARGRGRAWAAALLLGLAVVAALNLTRWSLPRLPAANGAAGAPALRLLSFNVNLDNHRTADVLDWLDTLQADVLALLEVTPDMDGLLQALRARYPHAVLQPQTVDPAVVLPDAVGAFMVKQHVLPALPVDDGGVVTRHLGRGEDNIIVAVPADGKRYGKLDDPIILGILADNHTGHGSMVANCELKILSVLWHNSPFNSIFKPECIPHLTKAIIE